MCIRDREQIKQRKRDEWNDILEQFIDDPQSMTNHLVMGMDVEQRKEARGKTGSKAGHKWF